MASLVLLSWMLIGFPPIKTGNACTAFVLRDGAELVVGKNFDWWVGCGLVTVNKRKVVKANLVNPGEQMMSWVSSYGSITFNHYEREFPMGGINEAGVVIELLLLGSATKYPAPDSRPAFHNLQWVQYQLDTSGSVGELIRSCSRVRIDSEVGVPFLVCDRSGNSAVIEFLNGRLAVYTGKTMETETLVNDYPYSSSCEYVKLYTGFGDSLPVPRGRGGKLNRFVKAASMVKDYDPAHSRSIVGYAFHVLETVVPLP